MQIGLGHIVVACFADSVSSGVLKQKMIEEIKVLDLFPEAKSHQLQAAVGSRSTGASRIGELARIWSIPDAFTWSMR
jgi:hypothetical protein